MKSKSMASSIEDENRDSEYMKEPSDEQGRQQLVRKGKLILYNRPANPALDESVVTVQRYNCFGTNLFPSKSSSDVQLATGVTSVANGDGKTVVSANLATFFALDTQDDTVLIDLNFSNPQLHQVFGVHPTPGVLAADRYDNVVAYGDQGVVGIALRRDEVGDNGIRQSDRVA
jgi:Mrp family chromosome partitioning ATPase